MIRALPGLLLLTTGQDAGPGTPRSLAESLDEAQRLLGAREFEEARALLLAAVAEHEEDDQVLYRWSEIEDLLGEASFRAQYEPPEAANVVAGELLAWDPESGRIKIHYRRSRGELDPPEGDEAQSGSTEAASDFARAAKTLLLHPALFTGPYEIEIRGERLVGRHELPKVFVDWRWNSRRGLDYGESFGIVFGDLSGISRVEGGKWSVLDRSTTRVRMDRPYSFQVRVSSSLISATYNGDLLFRVQRSQGEPGQFGFSSFDGLEEVVVSGEIEPSWIGGLIDERIQRDARAFRETFDPGAALPDRLDERSRGEPRVARELDRCAPEPCGPMALAELERMQALVREGKLDAALGLASALSEPAIRAGAKDWILAQLYAYLGSYERALEHCQRACAADAGFYEGRLFATALASGLGDDQGALRGLEQLALDFPGYLDTYERLVLQHLVAGRTEGARAVLALAVDNGIPPRSLRRAGRTLVRSERGPAWSETHVHESKHYVVASNVGREACFEIASELEDFYQKYVIHVRRPASRPEAKARVYFFAGLAGYEAYTEDLLGDPAENTLGLYSPWLDQLLVWNSPDRQSVLRTVRHEGFHQYLQQITDQAPVWLNEGFAEYFEQAELVDGRWKDDQVDPEHLAFLVRTERQWTPLRSFVRLDAPGFRVKSPLHYPQAWALVHFLLNSETENAERIDALLAELAAGTTRLRAVERAFDGVDWRELERELREHVASLR